MVHDAKKIFQYPALDSSVCSLFAKAFRGSPDTLMLSTYCRAISMNIPQEM